MLLLFRASHPRPIALLPAMLAFGVVGFSQSDEVLTARSAKNTVFIDVDPAIKDVRLIGNTTNAEDVLWEYATKESEPLILIKDNTYNLRLRVSNPLRYRITVKGKEYESDPYEEALKDVTNNLQQVINVVSRGALPFGSVAENDLRQLVSPDGAESKPSVFDLYKIDITSTPKEEKINGVNDVRDYGLRRAIMLYAIVDARVDTSNGNGAILKDLVSKAKSVEEYADRNMITEATTIVKGLVAVDLSTEGAKQNIEALKALVDSMDKRNQGMTNALKNLAQGRAGAGHGSDHGQPYWRTYDAYLSGFNASKEAQDKVKSAMKFVELTLDEFVTRMDQLLKQRLTLVDNLNKLLAIVQQTNANLSRTEHGTDLIYGEPIPKGQVEKVSVTVTEREVVVGGDYSISVKESELFTRPLKFMREHTFYPQAFPAVVFVNDVFPEFVAQEDTAGYLRLQQKSTTQGYVNLAGMVNFNFKLDRKTEVPFVQLGASTKKAQPQVFIGAGIRFTEWFCISAGAALTWQASLRSLSIGDKVEDQAMIEKDLKYAMSDPKLYFSIQLRPSTITKKP